MFTDINSEDRLVQKTFADYLHDTLGWEIAYAWNEETFGPGGNLGRDSERDAVLRRDLREALARLNPNLPESARAEAFQKLTQVDYARSMLQHNHQFYKYVQGGVPVSWRDASGENRYDHARVIDLPMDTSRKSVRDVSRRLISCWQCRRQTPNLQGCAVARYEGRVSLVGNSYSCCVLARLSCTVRSSRQNR